MSYPIHTNQPGGTPGAVAPNVAYAGTFIPTIWSGKLIEKFYDASVLTAIANTDYEGEISSYGDKVTIRTKPTITINNYVAGQTLTTERPSSDVVELNIDQGKYFSTILDDVMEIQSDLNQLSMWSDDAAEQMKIVIDTDVLADLGAGVDALNKGETAGRISGNIDLGATGAGNPLLIFADAEDFSTTPDPKEIDVIDLITRMGQALDEQNIPETGRWLLVPAWLCALIKRSDLRDASITGDGTSILRNGRLGMIDRFTLYRSNLLATDEVIAGHSHGFTFATQMTKMETLRAESTFGTLMRGLQVYGYKVIDGTAIVLAVCQKGVTIP